MDELIKFLMEHPETQIEFTFHEGGENDILSYPYIVLRITNKQHFAIRYLLKTDELQYLGYILTDLCERLNKEFEFVNDPEMRE